MWPFRRKKKVGNERAGQRSPRDMEERAFEEVPHPEPFVVTDTLDLHGFFPQQVPGMIEDFIDNAQNMKLHRLRIVHGKGKSRLKWEVHQALKANPAVASFGDAAPESGGWGATVVILKGPGAAS